MPFRYQHKLKRQRSLSLDQTTNQPDAKKGRYEDKQDHHSPQGASSLTHRALIEHNRYNREQNSKKTKTRLRRSVRLQRRVNQVSSLLCVDNKPDTELQRFARTGGPDLTSIRGFPDPTMSRQISRRSDRSSSSRQTTTSKRSGPYDANYRMKLAEAGIFPTEETDEKDNIVAPINFDDILERLNQPRQSLSPSRFTETEFQAFRRQAEQETLESETMQKSITVIEGAGQQMFSRVGGPFNNIELFDSEITMAVPDAYDGAPPLSIDHRVFDTLNKYIVPNTDATRPAAPNFFLEGKSRKGRADVAKLQAAHAGAIGARGMLSLQNYPSKELQYDGNAYSFTNTYHDGQLKMYATHPIAARTSGNNTTYHLTQLRTFAMTDSSKAFREGATHYRNARDLAKEHRESLIAQANQAARKTSKDRHSTSSCTTITTSKRTNSHSQENQYSPDTDTSTDELALEEDYPKRSRTEHGRRVSTLENGQTRRRKPEVSSK